MKILFFDDERLGLLTPAGIVDAEHALGEAARLPQQMKLEHLIGAFDTLRPVLERIAAEGPAIAPGTVKIRPPVTRPRSTLCAFTNYQDRTDDFEQPPLDFFYKGSAALIATGETVVLPDIPGAQVFQPEPELAYVIGRRAKDVSRDAALAHVFGYMNFIDVSARGIPARRTTFLPKGLETWAPVGPVIVTADEVPDPHALRVRLWIDGELRQDYSTGAMVNDIPAQIAWLTHYTTLVPGDVVACGTHHQGLSPINDGNHIEMEVEGLGRLTANVRSHGPVKTAHWRPPLVRPERQAAQP